MKEGNKGPVALNSLTIALTNTAWHRNGGLLGLNGNFLPADVADFLVMSLSTLILPLSFVYTLITLI